MSKLDLVIRGGTVVTGTDEYAATSAIQGRPQSSRWASSMTPRRASSMRAECL